MGTLSVVRDCTHKYGVRVVSAIGSLTWTAGFLDERSCGQSDAGEHTGVPPRHAQKNTEGWETP